MRVQTPTTKAVLASALTAAAAFCLIGTASADTAVTSFDPAYTTAGSWYVASQTAGGAASFGSVAGQSAAMLSTDNTNGAKVEVAVSNNFGKASDILSSLALSYDFYRFNAAGQNAAAAPSLKLTFYNAAYAGDGFVTLIYESYWQGSGNPASNAWTNVGIDYTHGLFWQNGGFGQANSAGGPPLNTLSGWMSAFDGGFGDASLVSVTMGLGSYNPGVTGYFDNVTISDKSGDGYAYAYDFGARAANDVPEPASLALVGIALAGVGAASRRRKAK